MKLCRLDLLRYGHMSDVNLAFPENVRLHVVHGANEAGKSTALAAIADALFGFGHRTDFDFLHGAPQLRVGFTLAARDGAMENFVRRKGRRETLRDMADQVVPDEALRRFLGGVSRDSFERGFGLDGARLREGGRELLRLGGEAGESLLAGAGLLNLRAVLTQLDEKAKSLVGDGRGRRRLSDAVDACVALPLMTGSRTRQNNELRLPAIPDRLVNPGFSLAALPLMWDLGCACCCKVSRRCRNSPLKTTRPGWRPIAARSR
jgi:hypothetical protein